MFTIYGGKTEFNQWEQGQMITNPNMAVGDKVRFWNASGETHPMIAYKHDGVIVVDVPNDLLQRASPILVDLCGKPEYLTRFMVNFVSHREPEGYQFIDNTHCDPIVPSNEAIPVPPVADVGQTIVVSAVDENGKPTEWEAAEFPAGGGEKWELIKTLNFTEDTYSIDRIETDNNGQPFELIGYQVISVSGSVSANQQFRVNPLNNGLAVSSTNAFCEPAWNASNHLYAEVKIDASRALWYKMGAGASINLRFAGRANANITQIGWGNFGSNYIKAGAVVEIWGVRA